MSTPSKIKSASQILKENPIPMQDLFKSGIEDKIIRLIRLGQVEVINCVAVNEEHKLKLLREIREPEKQVINY